MLEHELDLNIDRLGDSRGDTTSFFAFADTVVARSYAGGNECHGWMGVRFQAHPLDEPSQIVLHVRMLDEDAKLQQEALGIVGVNLHARRVLRAPRAGRGDPEPARPAHHRPHRDRHDRVPRHRVPPGRQPPDGAQARAARTQRRRHVRARTARCCSRARRCASTPSWSSAAASGRRPSSTSTCSSAPWRSSRSDPAVDGQAGAGAHRADHAQPARRRGRRRPARLPGPRRSARRLRDDGADLRLLRVQPAGRLPRRADAGADRHRHGRAQPRRPVRREEPRPAAGRDPGELRPALQERPEALRLPDAEVARR